MSRKTNSKWTEEEDSRLTELVLEMGPKQWTMIAERLGTRAGKQCRERWKNQLDPEIDHSPFTEADDARILQLVAEMGTKWAEISKMMPGRTENGVKNRYYSGLLKASQKMKKDASRRKKKAAPKVFAKRPVRPDVVPNTPPAQAADGGSTQRVCKIKAVLKPRPTLTKNASRCKPPRLQFKDEQHRTASSTCHLPLLADFIPSMAADRMLETAPGVWQRVLSQDFDAAVALLSMQWGDALKAEEQLRSDSVAITEATSPETPLVSVTVDAAAAKKAEALATHCHQPAQPMQWTDLLNHRHIAD